jgi:hypothetical protein
MHVRKKLFALLVAGSTMAGLFLGCGRAIQKFQIGFWEGLGNEAAATVAASAGLGG